MKVDDLIAALEQYRGMEVCIGVPGSNIPIPVSVRLEKYDNESLLLAPDSHHVAKCFATKEQIHAEIERRDSFSRAAKSLMDHPSGDPKLDMLQAISLAADAGAIGISLG